MENTFNGKMVMPIGGKTDMFVSGVTNMTKAQIDREYVIREVKTNDLELKNFLFTLGCYEGETVTLLSVLGENYVISVKDSRYSIDKDLAEVIVV